MTKILRTYILLSLLLIPIFCISCNGHTSSNQTATKKDTSATKKQSPRIIRTMGTQSENVNCQLLDKDGNIWFSIKGEGAYRYDGISFTNFTMRNGLCNNDVNAIIQDRTGNILLGTNNGICKYDGKTFTKYPVPDTLSIICMLEDKDGNIWFGAKNKGIYRYDGRSLTTILYTYKHVKFGDKQEKYISDIIQDKSGNIWFSSWNRGGVWRYDGTILTQFLPSADYYEYYEDERSNARLTTYTRYTHSPKYITDDMISSITEDKAGNIWFATRRHGLCRYDGNIFTSFGKNEGFLSEGAHTVFEDTKGTLWFTTEKDGIWCYDGKTFKNYNKAEGLINNSVMNVLEDKEGNLWFGTRWCGLSRFDGKTFTTFSESDN